MNSECGPRLQRPAPTTRYWLDLGRTYASATHRRELRTKDTETRARAAFGAALAVSVASNQSAARRWEASIRNNAGMALHGLGRYDEALHRALGDLARYNHYSGPRKATAQ